jgi:DNA mismatch repair ATPase MutS
MAELQRLKTVVDRAQHVQQQPGWTLLFLLDEILHGTNTSERLIAARQIIRHLLSQGAIGAVSTHDLRLADAPGLAEAAELAHFSETFSRSPEGVTMRFDYKLRPGIATTTNALKLMEIVGLPVDAIEELPSLSDDQG